MEKVKRNFEEIEMLSLKDFPSVFQFNIIFKIYCNGKILDK